MENNLKKIFFQIPLLFLSLTGCCAANHKEAYLISKAALSADSQLKLPTIIILPGAGMKPEGVMKSWENITQPYGWMVFVPIETRKEGSAFDQDQEQLEALMDEILKNYPVDQSRIFIVGTSAGGTLAEEMVKKNPSKWKGLVLVSFTFREAWGSSTAFSELPPILYLHGEEDGNFAEIRKQVESLKSEGVSVKLIAYPEAGHEHRPEWNQEIFKWIRNQQD